MPKYLWKARYSASGMAGVKSEGGGGRRDAVATLAESVGGKLEAFYFAFGDTDAYLVFDFPDNAAAARAAVAVGAAGAASVETVALLTPEEMDEALKGEADYRKPGG